MLVLINENALVINPDTIVAARLEDAGGEPRWRLVYIGQTSDSPQVFLTTVDELDRIITEVEAPKLAAAGGTQRYTRFKRPKRPDDGETHR